MLGERQPGIGTAAIRRIWPAWGLAVVLMLAFRLDMIAPVPLVKRQLAVGQDFVQEAGRYAVQVERAAWWQLPQRFGRRDSGTS